MNGLGMIVRADSGGLGSQTWEMWRHLHPERTLCIALGDAARGPEHPARFREAQLWGHDSIPDGVLADFAAGLSTVVTVECWYNPNGGSILRQVGARPVLVTNPELLTDTESDLVVPTDWERDRLDATLLPHPVAADRFAARHRSSARVFFHPQAAAMLDRNGTAAVLGALPHVTNPCRVIVRAVEPHPRGAEFTVGRVDVEWRTGWHDNYWEQYPPEADVLLLPRRYGGLCLPAQECAAMGMPAIMPALSPQHGWPWVLRTPLLANTSPVQMRGGTFTVHDPDPIGVALAMDTLTSSPDHVAALSLEAADWRERHTWEALLPRWEAALT